jgi:hypothetical protein
VTRLATERPMVVTFGKHLSHVAVAAVTGTLWKLLVEGFDILLNDGLAVGGGSVVLGKEYPDFLRNLFVGHRQCVLLNATDKDIPVSAAFRRPRKNPSLGQ